MWIVGGLSFNQLSWLAAQPYPPSAMVQPVYSMRGEQSWRFQRWKRISPCSGSPWSCTNSLAGTKLRWGWGHRCCRWMDRIQHESSPLDPSPSCNFSPHFPCSYPCFPLFQLPFCSPQPLLPLLLPYLLLWPASDPIIPSGNVKLSLVW